tara:strand:- start:3695 stop:4465 length:771 start_codon:yes stop_codon:yes gene_type:complete
MFIILEAGLGNQLFQIFAGLSKCLDNKENLYIYEKIINPHGNNLPYWNSLLVKLKPMLVNYLPHNNIYKEPSFEYKPIPNENIIKGFFQSPKYFEHNWDKLKNYLIFTKDIPIQTKTISIHFRIGDYLKPCHSTHHPILTEEYYLNAIKHFDNSYNYILFVEKDSIDEMNKRYLNLLKKINYKIANNINNIETDIDELQLMSKCEHNIIANSSFSWWGAYLNENINKKVIYSSVWFSGNLSNTNTKDLFKDNWIKI